jgi:hypothetical protein
MNGRALELFAEQTASEKEISVSRVATDGELSYTGRMPANRRSNP